MLSDLIARLRPWIARDAWLGRDKLEHAVWAYAYWCFLTAIVPNPWWRLVWFAAGAIGVELVQLARFITWVRKGRPQPRPAFCDAFSYKDLVADAVGMLAAMGSLAKVIARVTAVITPLALLTVTPRAAAAQADLRKAPAFEIAAVMLDSTVYGLDVPIYIRPFHGFVLLGPGGDTVMVINAARYDSLPAASDRRCGVTVHPAVAVSRLAIGRRDSVWWAQDFHERGFARVYAHWTQPLPSGDTLRLTEVWRRRSTCAAHDGTLVVLLTFRRGVRR